MERTMQSGHVAFAFTPVFCVARPASLLLRFELSLPLLEAEAEAEAPTAIAIEVILLILRLTALDVARVLRRGDARRRQR